MSRILHYPHQQFGHGCFLHALEGLYQKIAGRELKYTALIGKPSEITYHHADYLLSQQAKLLGIEGIETIYCIGDNPETDIYGGNLYNRYLQRLSIQRQQQASESLALPVSKKMKLRLAQSDGEYISEEDEEDAGTAITVTTVLDSQMASMDRDEEVLVSDVAHQVLVKAKEVNSSNGQEIYTKQCRSILVCTGVFSKDTDLFSSKGHAHFSHNHRDFVIDPDLKQPNHVVSNVLEGVQLVMDKERASIQSVQSKA